MPLPEIVELDSGFAATVNRWQWISSRLLDKVLNHLLGLLLLKNWCSLVLVHDEGLGGNWRRISGCECILSNVGDIVMIRFMLLEASLSRWLLI